MRALEQALAGRMADEAANAMNATKHKVSSMELRPAEELMKKAEKYLEQARDRLNDEAERYAQLAQEQLIFLIKTELREVLEKQEKINQVTAATAAKLEQEGRLSRSERNTMRRAGKNETELATRVRKLVTRIEGHADVFGFVLEQVGSDLDLVAERLRARPPEVGPFTRMLQDEITDRTRELLDSFKLELKRRQGQQQQQQGGNQGGKPPLVPPLAEIQMLGRMQDALRGQVVRTRTALGEREDLSDAEKELVKRLSHMQGNLGDVLEKFLARYGGNRGEEGR
jgi:hypothetical protein